MDEIFQTGLQGVQAGLNRAQISAHAISTSIVQDHPAEVHGNLLDLKTAERQVYFSAAVLKVADELLGTVLDELA